MFDEAKAKINLPVHLEDPSQRPNSSNIAQTAIWSA